MNSFRFYEYGPPFDGQEAVIEFEINEGVEWYLTTDSITIDKCTITWKNAELVQYGGDIVVIGDVNSFKVTGLKKNKLDILTDKIQKDKPVSYSNFNFDTRRMC